MKESSSDANGEHSHVPYKVMSSGASAGVAKTFVARQPIFDHNKRVHAYEILFRASPDSQAYDGVDGNMATSQVIASTMFASGTGDLLGGKRGFFNFTRDHLLVDYSGILDPKSTVIEILESVQPDEDVIKSCLRLKASGYKLALDDCVAKDQSNQLAKYADIIKVDFRGTDQAEQKMLAVHFRSRGLTMLAEKVETTCEFSLARRWGYSLFQGYFFAHPEIVVGKPISAFKKHYHSLLRVIHRPDFDYGEIEAVIKREPTLMYKFLLYLNSARFGWLSRITSIRHALVLLGAQDVRTWVSLAIIASLGADKPSELVLTGAIRAHFCELLGAKAGFEGRSDSLFMLGMLSVMDAIMAAPLVEVLANIHIARDVLDALLGIAGGDNRMALVYGAVRKYEIADWDSAFAYAHQLGVRPDAIPPMYVEALRWAERVFSAES